MPDSNTAPTKASPPGKSDEPGRLTASPGEAEASDEGQTPDVENQGRLALVIFLFVGVGALFVFPLSGWQGWHGYLSLVSVLLMAAGASCLLGALLGFLFGIPRTLQSDRPDLVSQDRSNPKGIEPVYQPNTNLEQISDWLTKILVGVGLTQLTKIPPGLTGLAAYLGTAFPAPESASTFLGTILVYFGVLGFLAGYLWTRLTLPRAFRLADAVTQQVKLVAGKVVEKASERIIAYSQGLVSALSALETAGATEQDKVGAIDLLRTLRQQFPTDRKVNILLGRLYKKLKQYDNAIQALSTFLDQKRKRGEDKDGDYADALYNRACYYALKGDKEQAFKDLLSSIELLPANGDEAKGDPDLDSLKDDPRWKKEILGEK